MKSFITEWCPIKLELFTLELLQNSKIINMHPKYITRIIHLNTYMMYCKQYLLDKYMNNEIQTLWDKININAKFYSPNIVALFGAIYFNNNLYVLWEYGNTNLDDYINIRKLLNEEYVSYYITRPLLSAIQYANDMGIIHSNIIPKRLIQFECNTWKLTGWNYAIYKPNESKNIPYVNVKLNSLNIENNSIYKSDIYAIGKLVELLLRYQPISLECKSFIFNSTNINIEKRSTVEELRNHKWIQKNTLYSKLRKSYSMNDIDFIRTFNEIKNKASSKCILCFNK